jgi:DNA-binding transcriptional MerR regulator
MERIWFKIGEAAQRVGVTPKDLRYWERVIPEIKPRRSKGNLRYYHLDELPRLTRIHTWLLEGLTVADCRQLMLTGHLTRALGLGFDDDEPLLTSAPPVRPRPRPQRDLRPVAAALRELLRRLDAPPVPD